MGLLIVKALMTVFTAVIVAIMIVILMMVFVFHSVVKVMAIPAIIASVAMLIAGAWVILVPIGRGIVSVMMIVRKIPFIPAIVIIIITVCSAIIVSMYNGISATIGAGIRIVGILPWMMGAGIQQQHQANG